MKAPDELDQAFDRIMANVDPAMVIVTTVSAEHRSGCLVGFHSQAGMEPDALAVWLSEANHTFRVAATADVFAVHFLRLDHPGDRRLAELFGTTSGDDIDKFTRCEWTPGPDGVPILTGCLSWIVGRKHALLQTSADHACLVLDPIECHDGGQFSPLRLSSVQDLEPGHDADDDPA